MLYYLQRINDGTHALTDYADFIDFHEETVMPLLEEVKLLNGSLKALIK